jgi:hypothetical protein
LDGQRGVRRGLLRKVVEHAADVHGIEAVTPELAAQGRLHHDAGSCVDSRMTDPASGRDVGLDPADESFSWRRGRDAASFGTLVGRYQDRASSRAG